MEDNRLKASLKGEAFLNYRPIGLDELRGELRKLKDAGRHIVYYRESPLGDGTDEAMKVLEVVAGVGIPIQMGDQAPPEWGELSVFMLYVSPFQFRFAVFKQQKTFTFAYLPESSGGGKLKLFRPQPKLQIHHGEVPFEADIRRSVDLLVSADRILETPQHMPQNAFKEETEKTASFHLVINYEGRQGWLTWYPVDELPENMQSLLRDCKTLGFRIIGKEG